VTGLIERGEQQQGERINMRGLSDKDITFVVQGPVLQMGRSSTQLCLQSIRRLFPDSRVILSTWKNSDLNNLSYDDLVLSDDPGAIVSVSNGLRLINNLNRQIVSTSSGLQRVSTRYSVKVRSDAILTGRGFVEFLGAFPWRPDAYRLFAARIVISKEFTRSAKSFVPLAYHPSDLFQFGLTDDLRLYWSITPVAGDRLKDYFLIETPRSWFSMFDRFRFTTEQYLFLDVLRRSGLPVELRDFSEITPAIIELSQNYLLSNFLPIEPDLLGVEHAKFRNRAHLSLMSDCIGLREFTSWYASAISKTNAPQPMGNAWPNMSVRLRAERLLREALKRFPLFQRIYAKRYLARGAE
jgi:hypothetical protein